VPACKELDNGLGRIQKFMGAGGHYYGRFRSARGQLSDKGKNLTVSHTCEKEHRFDISR
jgi:hypothetical protein